MHRDQQRILIVTGEAWIAIENRGCGPVSSEAGLGDGFGEGGLSGCMLLSRLSN
jgi:hypothetical protein